MTKRLKLATSISYQVRQNEKLSKLRKCVTKQAGRLKMHLFLKGVKKLSKPSEKENTSELRIWSQSLTSQMLLTFLDSWNSDKKSLLMNKVWLAKRLNSSKLMDWILGSMELQSKWDLTLVCSEKDKKRTSSSDLQQKITWSELKL